MLSTAVVIFFTERLVFGSECEDEFSANATINLVAYLNLLLDEGNVDTQHLDRFIERLQTGYLENIMEYIQGKSDMKYLVHHQGLEEILSNTAAISGALPHVLSWAVTAREKLKRDLLDKKTAQKDTEIATIKLSFLRLKPRNFIVLPKFKVLDYPGKGFEIYGNRSVNYEFEMMENMVTQYQWYQWTGGNSSAFTKGFDLIKNGVKIATDLPVDSVNWYSAAEFCNRMSIAKGFEPVYDFSEMKFSGSLQGGDLFPISGQFKINAAEGDITRARGYRLPTTDEQMLARHDGVDMLWHYDPKTVLEFGWLLDARSGPMPVQLKRPFIIDGNGFYDLVGNIDELGQNIYLDNQQILHVNCFATGGSFGRQAFDLEPFYTNPCASDKTGLRLVRTLNPQ